MKIPKRQDISGFVRKVLKNRVKITNPWKVAAFIIFGLFLFGQFFSIGISFTPKLKFSFLEGKGNVTDSPSVGFAALANQVTPAQGVDLPITWEDLGKQLVASGVIDQDKFLQTFGASLSEADKNLLTGSGNGPLHITPQNSQLLLDLLWALGLGNKNPVLDSGPISQDPSQTPNLASTGGWDALATGAAMDHFSRHQFLTLTPDQQSLVEEVAKGVYRPCCGLSAYFPDCNHGMAMLGALELGAAQGLNRDQLFRMALTLNSYWFSQNYLDLAAYFVENGTPWDKVNPEEVLGEKYSSGQGYADTRQQIKSPPPTQQGDGGCGA